MIPRIQQSCGKPFVKLINDTKKQNETFRDLQRQLDVCLIFFYTFDQQRKYFLKLLGPNINENITGRRCELEVRSGDISTFETAI